MGRLILFAVLVFGITPYPQKETEVTVCLDYDGELTCTYPAYDGGWTVTAQPDGILTDAEDRTYNYLYWEGVTSTEVECEPQKNNHTGLSLPRVGFRPRKDPRRGWPPISRAWTPWG